MFQKISTFTVLILFHITSLLFSQSFQLNWKEAQTYYDPAYSNHKYPYFSNEGYSLEGEVPVFTKVEHQVAYSHAEVINVQWESVPVSVLASTPLSEIPNQEEIFARIVKAREVRNLWVKIVPFKYVDKVLYRLKSFEIKTSQKPINTTFGEITNFDDSVLKTGDYYKISVDTTGVYKIDYDFLAQNGLNPSSINPSQIKIYGNGGAMLPLEIDDFVFYDLQENAIRVVGGEDNSFDPEDYILFYAQGPNSLKRNLLTPPIHITNIFEDKAYYFLRFDGGSGQRIPMVTSQVASNYLDEFDDIRYAEPELYNVNEVGKIWVGENFTVENTQEFLFDDLIEISNSVPVRCYLSLFTQNALNQGVEMTVNGQNVIQGDISTNLDYFETKFIENTQLTGNSISAKVTVDNSTNPLGTSWFNYIEFFFRQKLRFNGKQFNFRRLDNINNGNRYGFRISNANGISEVWNVSNWTKPVSLVNHGIGNTFDFSYQSLDPVFSNEFVIFSSEAAYTPEFVGKINNQNLRGLDAIDYVIITPETFEPNAQRLANFHQEKQNLNVTIVSPQEIYNEFSSGSQDIAAIRNFCRFLYKKENRLHYLMLLGDASYDYKDRIPNNTNIVPAYQSGNSVNLISSFVTDDYYGILDDGESGLGTAQLDLAIGRLPAANFEEANILIGKTLRYENQYEGQSSPFGIWRTKTKIVVDDDNPNDPFHNVVDSQVSQFIENTEPQFNVRKLYLDAFEEVTTAGGKRYPDVNEEIDNSVESGCLFMNYFGHGGPRGWAQERVLTANQIIAYNNLNSIFTRLPLFTTVTCDFSVWDNPNLDSAGEYLVKTYNGGGIGSITTSRAIGVGYGKVFNGILVNRLFEETGSDFQTFGEALRKAKALDQSSNSSDNYKVNLLGDPAISLYRPPRKIQLSTINGEDANTYNGIFRALDFITITGNVQNENNSGIDTSFNGKIEVELYDKREEKHTRNNPGYLGVLNYTEQNNRIYSGSSTVTNGEFTIEFYMPLDINYEVGNGKLVLYVENGETDGLMYDDTIKVGEINPEGVDDDSPPTARLFMNNRHFANGGITNKDPIFIACVTDSTGINSTGIGIGHDITLVLDGNLNKTKVLNSFYQGGEQLDCPNPMLKDYQKGMVAYNLKDIEKGEHQIKFKVWDINNNSTTETLDFVVVQEGEVGLVINRLLNWPNPFTDKTYFHFEHNCDEILEVQVQIFTITGKLVKTIRQQVTSEPYRKGYRTDKFGIEWDGLDDFGDKIGKGTYLFKATVKGSDSERCSGTATATEKLVILK